MIISDLNYLEPISNTSNVEGGKQSIKQKAKIVIKQYIIADAGNQKGKKNVSIGNTVTAVNVAIPTITQIAGQLEA